MREGILSRDAAEASGVIIGDNFNGLGRNGSNQISVAMNPVFNPPAASFEMFIKNGVSFVIDAVPYGLAGPRGDTGFDDEGFVLEKVPRANLTGVLINPDRLDRPLLQPGFYMSFEGKSAARGLGERLKKEYRYEFPFTQLDALPNDSKAIVAFLKPHVETAFSKHFGTEPENLTLRLVLQKLISGQLPVYDYDGHSIEL